MHVPVLIEELIGSLSVKPEGLYVDCTGGGGGHAACVLEKLGNGRLLILDRDPEATQRLSKRFREDSRVTVAQANFKDIEEVFASQKIKKATGIYADFGVSTWQLATAERGFSFKKDGELDMRMNPTDEESAKDVVNKYSEDLLSEIIYRYGEEKLSRRIARAIVTRRNVKPFTSTLDLAAVIKQAVPVKFHKVGYHPATQSFMAVRIHVNRELDAIATILKKLPELVEQGGRAAFISFHSLEDRLVKEAFNRYERPCTCPPEFPVCNCGKTPLFKVLTKKPLIPTEKEAKMNPLSRSAKLRAAEKL